MIKLELLLRHPVPASGPSPSLLARLEQHGLQVSACGRVTVTARASEADCARLFGAALAQDPLPVPPSLEHDISLITLAPPKPVPTQPK